MFQYAYALSLKNRGYNVKIDISQFETYKLHGGYQLDKYKLELPVATNDEISQFAKMTLSDKLLKLFFRIKNKKILKEKTLTYSKNLLTPTDNVHIFGYFQCEKYFKDINDNILNSFLINEDVSSFTMQIKDKILTSKNSVSLHVRRGDYVNNQKANEVHGTCTLEYYRKSIDFFRKKYPELTFFIFSDDIQWVKDNLEVEGSIFVDCNEPRIPHEDIYLMSLCKDNIIANSSFSWWGAWLNNNKDKNIIAPKSWFADKKKQKESQTIVAESWIRL
jgi:hypothetical protein